METKRKKPIKVKVFEAGHYVWIYPDQVIILTRMKFKDHFLKELSLLKTGTYETRVPEAPTYPVIEFTISKAGLTTVQDVHHFFKTEKLLSMAQEKETNEQKTQATSLSNEKQQGDVKNVKEPYRRRRIEHQARPPITNVRRV